MTQNHPIELLRIQTTAETADGVAKALGRLVEVLTEKHLLTGPEVVMIATGLRGEATLA